MNRVWGLKSKFECREDACTFIDELADAIEDLDMLGFSCIVDFDPEKGMELIIRKR